VRPATVTRRPLLYGHALPSSWIIHGIRFVTTEPPLHSRIICGPGWIAPLGSCTVVYLKIEMDRAFGQLDRRVYGRGRWIAPSGS